MQCARQQPRCDSKALSLSEKGRVSTICHCSSISSTLAFCSSVHSLGLLVPFKLWKPQIAFFPLLNLVQRYSCRIILCGYTNRSPPAYYWTFMRNSCHVGRPVSEATIDFIWDPTIKKQIISSQVCCAELKSLVGRYIKPPRSPSRLGFFFLFKFCLPLIDCFAPYSVGYAKIRNWKREAFTNWTGFRIDF